jgi:hypothetical protein
VDPTSLPAPTPALATPAVRLDQRGSLRWFLILDLFTRLFIWCVALSVALGVFSSRHLWPAADVLGDPRASWRWASALVRFIIFFNLVYVLVLVVLRLPIPTPREGRYDTRGRKLDRQVLWSCLLAVLTKARYEAPFPGFLVFHFANLPPLTWLMEPVFGPRSRSAYVTDPRVLDPHLVTLGRNVVIGFNTTVAGHYQERDAVIFKRTVIEDDVLVGGHVVIFGGVHICRGAMIGAGAIVLPDTVVGPNEFWAGVPARKVRELPAAT